MGGFLLRVLRGGEDVSDATLTRFYAIHAAVFPVITFTLLGIHLYLVQRQGMSIPPDVEERGTTCGAMPFLPNLLLRDLVGWLVALAIMAALAAYFPAELGSKADTFASAPAGIKPEWYFMFMFQTLKFLPAHILGFEGDVVGNIAFGLVGVVFLLIPFLGRPGVRGDRSRLFVWLGVAAILYILVLTVLGYTASTTP